MNIEFIYIILHCIILLWFHFYSLSDIELFKKKVEYFIVDGDEKWGSKIIHFFMLMILQPKDYGRQMLFNGQYAREKVGNQNGHVQLWGDRLEDIFVAWNGRMQNNSSFLWHLIYFLTKFSQSLMLHITSKRPQCTQADKNRHSNMWQMWIRVNITMRGSFNGTYSIFHLLIYIYVYRV